MEGLSPEVGGVHVDRGQVAATDTSHAPATARDKSRSPGVGGADGVGGPEDGGVGADGGVGVDDVLEGGQALATRRSPVVAATRKSQVLAATRKNTGVAATRKNPGVAATRKNPQGVAAAQL